MKAKFPYQITITWNEADQAFEARVPALKGCLAYGDTIAEAAREIRVAADLWIDAVKKNGFEPPKPDTALERLKALAPLVKMAFIAKMAGISVTTLDSKLKRGTPLTPEEERKLGSVLQAHGVAV